MAKYYKSVDLFTEPRNIVINMLNGSVKNEPEMSEFDSGFLCGLLKQACPHKIVEVGVAGGGTTAIIIQCMNMLGGQYEFHSVDYSEKFYRDSTKKTGFIVGLLGSNIDISRHDFMLGNVLPHFINDIGSEIDFLILDTTHVLPGEILDFLSVLPYLKNGCTVVLHDVASCQRGDRLSYGTQVLFDTVKAEKYYMDDDASKEGVSNIAAFVVNDETRDNILDVFNALMISWEHIPNNEQICEYRKSFVLSYEDYYAEYFDRAYKLNKEAVAHPVHDIMTFNQKVRRVGRIIIKGY